MITTEKLYDLFLTSQGITTDTRQDVKDKIFFGLNGKNFSGNQFAAQAISKGCKYAVVDDPEYMSGEKVLLVNNTLSSLQDIALHHRKKIKIPVIGITGSNGKTTTKELVTSVLKKKYRVFSTRGNMNNHIGVPLSILSLDKHNFAVIEMGASKPGEIRRLCEIALPHYGIITNVGKAHLEGFKSTESVKKTKGELFDFLKENKGKIFINYSDVVLKEMADRSGLEKIIYGNSEKSLCKASSMHADPFLRFYAIWSFMGNNGATIVQTQVAGSYNLLNFLSAAAVGLYFGINPKDIFEALEGYIPSNNRSQIIKTNTNTIILDAYNANPASMENALADFLSYTSDKKAVILGDMLELGTFAREEHENILEILKKRKDIGVYLVGKEFIEADRNNKFSSFLNTSGLTAYLKKHPLRNSLILIKGSRGIQLEKALDCL